MVALAEHEAVTGGDSGGERSHGGEGEISGSVDGDDANAVSARRLIMTGAPNRGVLVRYPLIEVKVAVVESTMRLGRG